MSRRRSKKFPSEPVKACIESLSHDGRGIARLDGKTTFIDGALPGEEVNFTYLSMRRRFDEGRAVEIFTPSPDRVEPRCPHFDICGGCSLQHMSSSAQIQNKQQTLLDNLQQLGNVQPEVVLEPLTGPAWGYRHKARLGAKYVRNKGRVLVGFREKRKSYVADMGRCEVLHPSVGLRIMALAELIEGLSISDRVPQIEVAIGDETTALVFRHLDPLTDQDLDRLRDFGKTHKLHIYLQSGGPDTVAALWPEDSRLSYTLKDHDIELAFLPTDFVQINPQINAAMVNRVLEFMELESSDRVLDLFCGLGNFSLPLAQRAGELLGVEGDADLVQRARDNATHNGIANAEFYTADLTQDPGDAPWATGSYDKILLDPPRSGARELMDWIPGWHPQRIVYVSCHPGSLARDAGVLVNEYGYRLVSAGVMDMFPHTAHVESIAVFEKN